MSMKHWLFLLLVPGALKAHVVHCINGTDKMLDFYVNTSVIGKCQHNVQRGVKPGTMADYAACAGACITSVQVKQGQQSLGAADFGAGACEDVDVIVYQKLREIPKLELTSDPRSWTILSAQGKSDNIRYGDRVVLVTGNKFLQFKNNQLSLEGTQVAPETSWIILSVRDRNDRSIVHSTQNGFFKPVTGNGYLKFVAGSKQPIVADVAPGESETWTFETMTGFGAPLNYAVKINLRTVQPTARPYFSGWIEHESYVVVDKHGGGDVGHIIAHGFEEWGRAMNIDQVRKSPDILRKSFEIAGLGVKLGALIAAKGSSAGLLEGFRQGSGGLLRGLPEIIKTLQIRKIEFEGSAKDMVNGVFPSGTLEVVLVGKKYTLNDVKFDPLGAYNSLKRTINQGAAAITQEWDNFINGSNKIATELNKAFAF